MFYSIPHVCNFSFFGFLVFYSFPFPHMYFPSFLALFFLSLFHFTPFNLLLSEVLSFLLFSFYSFSFLSFQFYFLSFARIYFLSFSLSSLSSSIIYPIIHSTFFYFFLERFFICIFLLFLPLFFLFHFTPFNLFPSYFLSANNIFFFGSIISFHFFFLVFWLAFCLFVFFFFFLSFSHLFSTFLIFFYVFYTPHFPPPPLASTNISFFLSFFTIYSLSFHFFALLLLASLRFLTCLYRLLSPPEPCFPLSLSVLYRHQCSAARTSLCNDYPELNNASRCLWLRLVAAKILSGKSLQFLFAFPFNSRLSNGTNGEIIQ